MIETSKIAAILIMLFAATIFSLIQAPSATAPILYGSGDDTGLVGRWSCEGNFMDSSCREIIRKRYGA